MRSASSLRDLFHPLRILWQAFSGYYCVGLARSLPLGVVIGTDYGQEYPMIEGQTGIRLLGLESLTGERREPDVGSLERAVPEMRKEILTAVRGNGDGPWAFLCPLPCTALPALAQELGCRCLSPDAKLGGWLNDKSNFLGAVGELGLPRLAGQWLRLRERSYGELQRTFGRRFVVQRTVGAAGSGTTFVRSERDLGAAADKAGDEAVWVAPEIEGPSLNINGVVLERNVLAGCVSVQLVGLEILSAKPGMYCGNDFISAGEMDKAVLADVREQTLRIGNWLSRLGFRGLFGLDFQIDPADGRCHAVDLNPRWQGSTTLSTQAEALLGRLPLAVAEIAWKLGVLGEDELVRGADAFWAPLEASQMVLRFDSPQWGVVEGEVDPGVYSISPAGQFLRPGIRLDDLAAEGELLVTGAVPCRGYRVEAGGQLMRLYSKRPVLHPATGCVADWAGAVTAAMRDALALRPLQDLPATARRIL